MSDEETKLTPAQLAEIEEGRKSVLDHFKDLLDEAKQRLEHGTSLTPAFVAKMQAIYDAAQPPRSGR